MSGSQKPENPRPSMGDFDTATGDNSLPSARPPVSLRNQVITSLKLLITGGLIVMGLWLIDRVVAP
jgi:hypothetical protein